MAAEPEICTRALGGNNVEAYYYEGSRAPAMAIDPGIEPERGRLWELVAHGMEHVPHPTRRRIGRTDPRVCGFFFFRPGYNRAPDQLAVAAVAEVIAELEPEWVSAVEDARLVADDRWVLAAWSEVPIEAVLAVLENWRARL